MKKIISALTLLCSAMAVQAAPERTLPLEDVSLEHINIEGRIQTWSLNKVCIDGQAYWLILGVTGPNGISASFKDGKPEQCHTNPSN